MNATHSALIADAVAAAARTLAPHSESPHLDAELLLCKVLGCSRSALIARGAEGMAALHLRTFSELLAQRAGGAPVAYLTGTREFWSLRLRVTPAVLVPRPETELLVEQVLSLAPAGRQLSILDLGTGSGAIALAIAAERPTWRIIAVDLSADALEVAAGNAQTLRLSNIEWRLGSWFDAVPGEQFDLVVANPPYIAALDPALASLAAEPAMALSPGPTGLEALGAIVAGAPPHLRDGGRLLLEHGMQQADDVAALLRGHGFAGVRSISDLSGKPRVTLGSHNMQRGTS
jgi:release factor glutamine methyltransferase